MLLTDLALGLLTWLLGQSLLSFKNDSGFPDRCVIQSPDVLTLEARAIFGTADLQ